MGLSAAAEGAGDIVEEDDEEEVTRSRLIICT